MKAIGIGAGLGIGLGLLELTARAVRLGELPWAPADPAVELLRAAVWTALAYGLVGALVGLPISWLPAKLRLGRAWIAVPVLGLLAVLGLAMAWRQPGIAPDRPQPAAGAPSVLLVTVDTLRADGFGHGRGIIAELEGLGIRFEQAIVQSILTGPSHASILSGLRPATHGVTENIQALDAEVPTLAENLARAGWQTAAFAAGYPVKERALRVLSRFDHYDDDFREERAIPLLALETFLGRFAAERLHLHGAELDPRSRPAEGVTDSAVDWLGERSERPFFAWVHYFDAHLPYDPPERFFDARGKAYQGSADGRWYQLGAEERDRIIGSPEDVRHMRMLYDAEVRRIEEQLARLVSAAREQAGDGDLWIVITSDHGESFGEHEIWFERDLYDDCIRVPLIIVPPGAEGPGRVVTDAVRSIDIAPTLYEALAVAPPAALDGVSLLPLLESEPREVAPPATAAMYPTRGTPRDSIRVAVRSADWKAIWDLSLKTGDEESRELYDLGADGEELSNRYGADPARWQALRARVDPRVLAPSAVQEALSPEELEVLRALGYTE